MAPVKKRNKNEVRRAIRAWICCAPVLAVFAVIAKDAWISIEARRADYELARLATERRQIAEELDNTRSAQSKWTDISKISELIQQLNMLLPDPQQIQVVIAHPGTQMPQLREQPQEGALEMAGAPPGSPGKTAVPAVSVAPAVALPVMVATPPAVSAVLVPVSAPTALPEPVATPAAYRSGPSAPKPIMLDLPKEPITDLDSPDAPLNDLLPKL